MPIGYSTLVQSTTIAVASWTGLAVALDATTNSLFSPNGSSRAMCLFSASSLGENLFRGICVGCGFQQITAQSKCFEAGNVKWNRRRRFPMQLYCA